jgi:phage-related minor tail protein
VKLSRPAFINAFLCPGLGHIAAGWRVTGALLVLLAVTSAGAPFVAFIWGIATPPECWVGVWFCGKQMFRHAWSGTWPLLLVSVPVFAVVYVVALLHGNRLTVKGA